MQFILDPVEFILVPSRAGLALRYVIIMMVALNGGGTGLKTRATPECY